MDLVTGWWSEELAEERCWAVISVREGHRVLVHFHNRPAGDYHAVCASLNHQGSGCAWPCLWCETRNMAGGSRLCKDCHRYSCHHSAFTGIHPSILPLTHIPPEQLGEQPEYFTTSVESSRELLQPRRTQQPSTADKAADAQQKKSGLGKEAAPSTCAKRGRVSNSNQEAAPAKRAAQASPLDPIQPIFVHPDVKDVNGRHTLRPPPPAPLRTANSLRYSSEVGARFGCYLPSKGQGRTYVWAEVNPRLIERGKLKDPEDRLSSRTGAHTSCDRMVSFERQAMVLCTHMAAHGRFLSTGVTQLQMVSSCTCWSVKYRMPVTNLTWRPWSRAITTCLSYNGLSSLYCRFYTR
jgi:hypothetical protein